MLHDWKGGPFTDQKCFILEDDLAEGKQIVHVRGLDPNDAKLYNHQGALGGSVDDLSPPVLVHEDNPIDLDPYSHSWECSANWVGRLGYLWKLTVFPWDMSREIEITSPATDPENMSASQLVMRKDAFFWTTMTSKRSGINVWDPKGGTRPFQRWIGDYTKGAGNLGTDGVDMVWSYGEGKAPNDTKFANPSMMTAPFTTNPDELEPRRLRSQPTSYVADHTYEVGCGHATRDVGQTSMVVRISDGVAWTLPMAPELKLYKPLGLTCEELFVMGEIGGRINIARVRLDSLGAGSPPD
jgi:hypothetical protein